MTRRESVLLIIMGCLLMVFLWGLFKNSHITSADDIEKQIHQQVVEDAIKQYEIAERSGSAMDAYVGAGLVVAACLQAKDEENYQKWKFIEKRDGIKAGMPLEILDLN